MREKNISWLHNHHGFTPVEKRHFCHGIPAGVELIIAGQMHSRNKRGFLAIS
jgi:hypothetical protein